MSGLTTHVWLHPGPVTKQAVRRCSDLPPQAWLDNDPLASRVDTLMTAYLETARPAYQPAGAAWNDSAERTQTSGSKSVESLDHV